jgi:hypothetical protein
MPHLGESLATRSPKWAIRPPRCPRRSPPSEGDPGGDDPPRVKPSRRRPCRHRPPSGAHLRDPALPGKIRGVHWGGRSWTLRRHLARRDRPPVVARQQRTPPTTRRPGCGAGSMTSAPVPAGSTIGTARGATWRSGTTRPSWCFGAPKSTSRRPGALGPGRPSIADSNACSGCRCPAGRPRCWRATCWSIWRSPDHA